MKTDIATYICNSLVKQRGVNVLTGVLLIATLCYVGKLRDEVKALKTEVEGRESYSWTLYGFRLASNLGVVWNYILNSSSRIHRKT